MRILIMGVLGVTICVAQQTIAVRNAASGNANIAPGAIIDIQQLTPPRIVNPDPNRVSISIQPLRAGSPATARIIPAPLLSIWALLPADLALGSYLVTLTVDGVASAPAPMLVSRSGPGLFTKELTGTGGALAQNQAIGEAPELNRLTSPAAPGEYVILWGTGLGTARAGEVMVEFGGLEIVPDYAGPAPDLPGLDQINFRVPDGIPDGCYVPVVVTGPTNIITVPGGPVRVASNEVTLAKSGASGPCRHPFGLSEAEMSALDAGQRIVFAAAQLRSFGPSDSASIDFTPKSALDIELLAREGGPASGEGCVVTPLPSILPRLLGGDADAGASLKLTGPGVALEIPRLQGSGLYSAELEPPGFAAGPWRLEAPGGATIGAFAAELPLPPKIRWTNRDALATIDRAQDLRVIWDGAGYTDADGAVFTLQGFPGSVVCRASAAAGGVTVPAAMLSEALSNLPLSALLQLEIRPRADRRMLFSMPLTSGGTAGGMFDYYFLDFFQALTR